MSYLLYSTISAKNGHFECSYDLRSGIRKKSIGKQGTYVPYTGYTTLVRGIQHFACHSHYSN